MNRDFWGIDGEIWGGNRYIISNFHSLHPPPQIKNTPCKIGQMFKRKGGGVKGLLNNVKKTALFLHDGFPYSVRQVVWKCQNNIYLGEIIFQWLKVFPFLLCHGGGWMTFSGNNEIAFANRSLFKSLWYFMFKRQISLWILDMRRCLGNQTLSHDKSMSRTV